MMDFSSDPYVAENQMKAIIFTQEDEATINSYLGRTGADEVETVGATVIHFIDDNGDSVPGVSLTAAVVGTVEYPSLASATAASGSETDASGIAVIMGASGSAVPEFPITLPDTHTDPGEGKVITVTEAGAMTYQIQQLVKK